MKVGDIVKCVYACSVLTVGNDYKIMGISEYHFHVIDDEGMEMGIPPVYFAIYFNPQNVVINGLHEKIKLLKQEVSTLQRKIHQKNDKIDRVKERQQKIYSRLVHGSIVKREKSLQDVFNQLSTTYPYLYSLIPKPVIEWAERNSNNQSLIK